MKMTPSDVIFFIAGVIIFASLCVLVKYATTPVSELPTWAWWFLGGK